MGFRLLRFVNGFILVAVIVLTLTGVYGLFWTHPAWIFDLHRFTGWAFLAVLPWKVAISVRSLRRGLAANFERGVMVGVSLFLTAVAVLVFGLGLAWAWRMAPEELWLRQTAISWHWMLSLALLVPLSLHVWRRWPRPRRADFISRRAALKVFGLGAAALLGWRLAESAANYRSIPSSPRRHTGSRLAGAFTGNQFPVTNNPGEGRERIDPEAWCLVVEGAVSEPSAFSYDDLLSWTRTHRVATLDCTLGWYTIQEWRGIPLMALLEKVGYSSQIVAVRFVATSGYARTLPVAEAREVLLATHVGDEPLDHWHGFPLRAVAPTRRGWYWVKWLARIDVVGL